MQEGWICKYEIRDDGVYLNGEKVAERTADDMVERFDFEQQLFIGVQPHRRLFQAVRRIFGGDNGTGRD